MFCARLNPPITTQAMTAQAEAAVDRLRFVGKDKGIEPIHWGAAISHTRQESYGKHSPLALFSSTRLHI
jgi:hypothetical protein